MSRHLVYAGVAVIGIGLAALIWWDARVRSAAAVPDLDAPARISAGRAV